MRGAPCPAAALGECSTSQQALHGSVSGLCFIQLTQLYDTPALDWSVSTPFDCMTQAYYQGCICFSTLHVWSGGLGLIPIVVWPSTNLPSGFTGRFQIIVISARRLLPLAHSGNWLAG